VQKVLKPFFDAKRIDRITKADLNDFTAEQLEKVAPDTVIRRRRILLKILRDATGGLAGVKG
jgi:hypothetical protein